MSRANPLRFCGEVTGPVAALSLIARTDVWQWKKSPT